MAKRPRLHDARKLAQVQDIRRAAAEAAMIDAREAEHCAEAAARAAEEKVLASGNAWLKHMASPNFSPEFAELLGAHLMMQERAAVDARDREEKSHIAADERRETWQCADAQRSLAQRGLHAALSVARRKRQDRMADMLSDSVTYRWTRT